MFESRSDGSKGNVVLDLQEYKLQYHDITSRFCRDFSKQPIKI